MPARPAFTWREAPQKCPKCDVQISDAIGDYNPDRVSWDWQKGDTPGMGISLTLTPSPDWMAFRCKSCHYGWQTTCSDDPDGYDWDNWLDIHRQEKAKREREKGD